MGMMPFEVPHSLPAEEARKRIEALLDYWKRKYGIQSSWTDKGATLAGKAMGVAIDGMLAIEAGRVNGQAKDPGMLLRGQAQKYLTKKFAEYLDGSKSLEDIRKLES